MEFLSTLCPLLIHSFYFSVSFLYPSCPAPPPTSKIPSPKNSLHIVKKISETTGVM